MANYVSRHTGANIDNKIDLVGPLNSKMNTLLSNGETIGDSSTPIFLNNGALTACSSAGLSIYNSILSSSGWEYYINDTNLLEDMTKYKNKYHFEFFSVSTINSSTYDNLKNTIPRIDIHHRYGAAHSSTSGNQFGVHQYLCRCTTYLCTPVAKDISFRWASDDEGAGWFNGTYLGANSSCAYGSTYTVHLNPGINEICIIYHENDGGEWMIVDPVLSSIADVEMYAVPVGGWRQTIIPNVVKGKNLTSNTLLLPAMIQQASSNLADVKLLSDYGISSASSNTITINIANYKKPNNDLTVYWAGYTP